MKKFILLMTFVIAGMAFSGCTPGEDNLLDGADTTAVETTRGVNEDTTAVTSAAIEGVTTGTDVNDTNVNNANETIPVTTEGLETNSAS